MKKFVMLFMVSFIVGVSVVCAISLRELQDSTQWYEVTRYPNRSVLYLDLQYYQKSTFQKSVYEAMYCASTQHIVVAKPVFNLETMEKFVSAIYIFDAFGREVGSELLLWRGSIPKDLQRKYRKAFKFQESLNHYMDYNANRSPYVRNQII